MGSEEQSILVTGKASFIDSHTAVQLLQEGFRISLVGPQFLKKLQFHLGDLRNKDDLEELFSKDRLRL